ncbi:hypothetical protein HS048_36415 [Planomonospora sp. ID91781]|uniref:hypothetical protein n=1 Tax=Planomonospora sp. ID91781 TaxID=2738135 RepID=UPI0018C40E18|nr:hypothetical protein [Planomonospora sp. ID91781]MBG0826153.1 hypothetical protein [Planomonospora sp. ID91781]
MSTPAPDERPLMRPWREIAAEAGPLPDMTPLTPQEREELRRRLDAPGGARKGLTAREQEARSRMGIIRSPQRIAEVETVAHAQMTDGPYRRGILDAIAWATGRRPRAPLSDRQSDNRLPSAQEMWREAILGEEIAYGRHELRRSQEHRSYGVGVEATLLWLIARSDEPPN